MPNTSRIWAGPPRGQGCEAESDTLFASHWSWTTRCVGTVGRCRGNRVSKRHGHRIVPRPGQIRPAVCDEGARAGHADAEQAVDDEAQASGPVLTWHGRRGTFLRLSDGAEHNTNLNKRRLDWQCSDVQVNLCERDPAEQSHNRDVEREPAGGVSQLSRERVLRDRVRMRAWVHASNTCCLRSSTRRRLTRTSR